MNQKQFSEDFLSGLYLVYLERFCIIHGLGIDLDRVRVDKSDIKAFIIVKMIAASPHALTSGEFGKRFHEIYNEFPDVSVK